MRQFSIRSLLGLSLLFLVLVPAMGLAYVLIQRTSAVVDELAGKSLQDAVARGQADVQAHLGQAYRALDGLLPENQTSLQTAQALEWVRDPALFAPMAFALTRSSPDLRFVYFSSADGSVHGVENAPEGFRFGGRGSVDSGTRLFSSRVANASLKPAGAEGESPDPLSRPWYDAALQAKARVFSPVTLYSTSKQLVLTLSQPVYDSSGAAAGVLGADLSLQALSGLLKAQLISPRGAAFVVDENGFMLASTADEQMTAYKNGQLVLRTPHSSSSAMVRSSFAALEQKWSGSPDARNKPGDKIVRLTKTDDPLLGRIGNIGAAQGLQWTLVVVAPESDFSAEANSSLIFALVCIGMLMLTGTLISSFSARHIERFLAYLQRSVEQIGAGNVPPLSQVSPVRELTELSLALHECGKQINDGNFDALSEAVIYPSSVSELPDTTVEAIQAELFARTTELAAARDLAMSATRSKAAFLAVISHELRTPLNGVVGMSSLLANTTLNEEQRDYLRILCLSSNQLQALVDEILEFSRTESGELFLQMAPLNVRDVVLEACETATKAAQAKGLQLLVDVPARVPRTGGGRVPWVIQGDATRLGQVVGQVVLNAVKFTESGSVSVKVRPLDNPDKSGLPMLEVRIRDTGPGIAADQLDNVFMAFTQLDSSTSRKHSGTSLGLATCKRLVELMGGMISVESEPGKGSLFWFTALAPWADPGLSVAELPEVQPLPAPDTLAPENRKLSILVVDDNPINLKVACAMLLKVGYNILTAEGGQQAIDSVGAALGRGELLGAVLMDVHMPDIDGIKATKAIIAAHGSHAPPIIALTAGDSSEDRQLCLDAGMVEYLTKPLQLSALVKTLDRWVMTDITQPETALEVQEEKPHPQAPEAEPVVEAPRFERFSDADISMPTGLVDFERLNDFKEFDDSQLTMTKEVIGLLFSEVPVQLAAIERAILKGDASALGRAAHSLRGAASNVGAVTVQHLCSVLERATLDSQAVPADASGCLVALRIAWNRTRPLLENWR